MDNKKFIVVVDRSYVLDAQVVNSPGGRYDEEALVDAEEDLFLNVVEAASEEEAEKKASEETGYHVDILRAFAVV